MRLSRKKAFELCIMVWTWCARTGKEKDDWPKWEKYKKYNKPSGSATLYECWFCEYGYQRRGESHSEKCKSCPYYKDYGFCFDTNIGPSYYKLWEDSDPKADKVNQVRSLREKERRSYEDLW